MSAPRDPWGIYDLQAWRTEALRVIAEIERRVDRLIGLAGDEEIPVDAVSVLARLLQLSVFVDRNHERLRELPRAFKNLEDVITFGKGEAGCSVPAPIRKPIDGQAAADAGEKES